MFRYLLSKFYDIRIRNKIIIIYLPIIIVSLFLVVFISNSIFTKTLTSTIVSNIQEESKLIVSGIEGIHSSAEICANILARDIGRIFDENNANSKDPISFTLPRNRISAELSYALITFKKINYAAFIDLNSNIIATDQKLINDQDNILKSELVETISQVKTPANIWFKMQFRDYLVLNKNIPVKTVGKKVFSSVSGEILGYVIINIPENTFSSIFPKAGNYGANSYFIIDDEYNVISSANKQDILKPIGNRDIYRKIFESSQSSINVEIDSNEYLIVSSPMKDYNWKLLNQISMKDVAAVVNINSYTNLVLGLLCTIFALICTLYLSRWIVKPIKMVINTINENKQGSLIKVDGISSKDEIGILAYNFNEMIDRIKDLLDKINQDQKKEREYELALIQSQIKPHFLYNTLDLIYVLCIMGDKTKASTTIKALADFYRVTLSHGKEIICVKEELKSIQDYLLIQRERYLDILDYSIEVNPDIMDYSIIKMTLQPLVENAIYHGIRLKSSPGRVMIKGYAENDTIILKVLDDGVGISKRKLRGLLDPDPKNPPGKSFGIKSVNERIKLYFGEEYGLTIESNPGSGTEVTVTIPKRTEKA